MLCVCLRVPCCCFFLLYSPLCSTSSRLTPARPPAVPSPAVCLLSRLAAAVTAATTALCLLVAVVHVGRLPATRTEALDLGYQYVDPQRELGVEAQAVKLPAFGDFGTDHAFLGMGDGSGQSTRDRARFQQLAVERARTAAGGHAGWQPLSAEQLVHHKGVQFKGFNHKKAALLRKAKKLANAEGGKRRQQQQLWIQPDNGVYTTINVRGTADPQGGIQYNSNFVYGPPGTPQQQPDPVSDQWWRYTDTGYKTLTGPSTGGFTPNYEMINVGPMESDGSDWGYVPSPATPVYNYFPSEFYPSSSAYNYPASVNSEAVGKEVCLLSSTRSSMCASMRGHKRTCVLNACIRASRRACVACDRVSSSSPPPPPPPPLSSH